MRVGLHDADGTKFPNLVLMKLSAWYKAYGGSVFIYKPEEIYDIVYSSKVFTYNKISPPDGSVFGGTGYKSPMILNEECEHIMPDYGLYGCKQSYGFLTRGCIRKCKHCVVPEKEGNIRANADIEEFLAHKECVLMDNNVLAHGHGIEQIEKISRLGIKIDFNQGLDARLIDGDVAKRLAKVKWLHPVRLACDSQKGMESLHKAVELLRWHNVSPKKYFVYMIVEDIDEAMDRAKFIKGLYCDPWAQPFRDPKFDKEPPKEFKDFARWVNFGRIFNSVSWENYRRRQ